MLRTPEIELRILDLHDPAAAHLIELSDQYMSSLYPPESNHLEAPEAFDESNAALFGAYISNELVGCGGVKILDDDEKYGEIKRVFVPLEQRGKGIARSIMQHIESHLTSAGMKIARLEAGTRQPEALELYAKLGYVERAPFGSYIPDPLSIFMEKRLGA